MVRPGFNPVLMLTAWLAGSLAAGGAAARNIALLIAVGRFSDPQMQGSQLLGPADDLDSIRRALTDRWSFAPADVHSLADEAATHASILAEIAALERRSAPGDTVLIYFSGHGTSASDNDNSFDLPYATGAWVPFDLDLSSVASANRSLIIGRRDLVPLLGRLDQQGRWVVVVSDSCYSGQVVRTLGSTVSHSRYLPLVTRDLGVARVAPPTPVVSRPPPPPYPYRHVVLLSGASDSETGADISSPQDLARAPTLDGRFHGAFTDAFLRLLGGHLLSPPFTYSQSRSALNEFLEHRQFAQHPQLLPSLEEDPDDLGSRVFLDAAQTPVTDVAAAQAGLRAAGLRVRLEATAPGLRAAIAALPGVALVDREPDLAVTQQGDRALLAGPAGDPILATGVADPVLLRRIAAEVWLDRVLPAADASLGLRAATSPGSRGNTFVQCESFAVELRLQRPAYVMLLDLDPQGHLTVLYPAHPSERALLPAGLAVPIPSNPKDAIVVVPPFGSDTLAVLAFAQPPKFLEDFTAAAPFETTSSRGETLARGLASAAGPIDVARINVHTYPGTSGVGCRG